MTNSGKIFDQSFLQIQKTLFFGSFHQFWGQKFFQKIWPCHAQHDKGF